MKITTNKDKWRVSNALKCLAMVLFSVSIAYGCASSAYKEAKEINTVEAYNEFLREHSGSEYVEDALKRRLDAAYEVAKSSNSIAAYDEFLRKYQRNRYTSSVLQLRDKSAFTNAERQNTIPAYEWYLREYPKGKFASRANSAIEKIRFDELSEENTIASYRRYLRLHPKGKFVVQARNNIEKLSFDIAEKLNSIASYGSYLKDYPKGKFAATADDRRERLMFGQAEQRDTFDSYRKYLREYPEGEFAAIAAEKQELRAFDGAKARNTINSYGEYLNLYPDGKFAIEAYESKEELWFDKAKNEHSINSYDAYLNEYPNGEFFAIAYQSKEELWFNQANSEHSINSYNDYLSEYPDGEFFAEVSVSKEQLMSAQAQQAFAEAKSKNTVNSYWQYIYEHPGGDNVSDALELLQSANREIIWTLNAKDSYDFRVALSPKNENFIGKLKDYPLHYFVYLYSQAAEGLYMLYGYDSYYLRFVEPIPPILELPTLAINDPSYPVRPKLTKGEFETSAAFTERENAALKAWQDKKDLLESPVIERDDVKLAAWQKRQDSYRRAMIWRNKRSKHPGQILLWQFHATVTALLLNNLDFQLQYDTDRQVFDYTIKSNQLNMAWQGELPIGLEAAEQFKVNISKPINRQLHFYLSPSGMLQLAKVTDLATSTSFTTQNNSLQPAWLPDAANLAELPLRKLSLSSNLDNTITWIEGRTFGSLPIELLLPAEDYEIEVAKHPYAFFSGYDNEINLQSDTSVEVELELYGPDKADQIREETSWSVGSSHSYYTKIDRYGNELSRDAPAWACVRDNKTGLVWEVKTNDASIHNKHKKYRWGGKTVSTLAYEKKFDKSRVVDNPQNWNVEGVFYGDWDELIDASNSEQFCGHSDWRVPTLDEFSTLVRCYHDSAEVRYEPNKGCVRRDGARRGEVVFYDDDELQRPTINVDWFPNEEGLPYWSANAHWYAKDRIADQHHAWLFSFDGASDDITYSSANLRVRLVRASR